MKRVPFIAIEGPIGVGKTSLAKAISSYFSFQLLKEIVDENPFIGKFYTNKEEWGFQTEMFFLCNRYKQLEDLKRHRQPVVADYHIFKSLIFARRSLKTHEFKKFMKIYGILTADMPQPNVIIYLHASLETLLKRIEIRGRAFEKNMQETYLQKLSADYGRFMSRFEAGHPDIPVLKFDCDTLDFIRHEHDLTYMLQEIAQTLQKGVHTHGTS